MRVDSLDKLKKALPQLQQEVQNFSECTHLVFCLMLLILPLPICVGSIYGAYNC
jgi:hypothetical protein